jgi:hypothetical protein
MNHGPNDARNDTTLAREIESMLAVDPSPEFVARVRTRVASEPIGQRWRLFPRVWSFEPLFAVGILAVVVLLVVPFWLRSHRPAIVKQPAVSTSPAPSQRLAGEPIRSDPDATSDVTIQRVGRQRDRSIQVDASPAADTSPFPDVLISDGEQRAFAVLLATIEQGRFPPLPVVDAAEQAKSLEPPALEVPALVIEPLPQIAALE